MHKWQLHRLRHRLLHKHLLDSTERLPTQEGQLHRLRHRLLEMYLLHSWNQC